MMSGPLLATRGRRVLVGLTLLLGLLAAIAVALGSPPDQRSLPGIASPAQSLMSVLTPFSAVLVTAVLVTAEAREGPAALTSRWVSLALYAGLIGLWGFVITVVATVVAGGTLERIPTMLVAGVVVQLVATGVGAAFGVLIRPRWLAMAATIVIPLGVWALFGLAGLTAAQSWLTPYAAVQRVFAAPMTPLAWWQWLVVAVIWVVGLNAWAYVRVRWAALRQAQGT